MEQIVAWVIANLDDGAQGRLIEQLAARPAPAQEDEPSLNPAAKVAKILVDCLSQDELNELGREVVKARDASLDPYATRAVPASQIKLERNGGGGSAMDAKRRKQVAQDANCARVMKGAFRPGVTAKALERKHAMDAAVTSTIEQRLGIRLPEIDTYGARDDARVGTSNRVSSEASLFERYPMLARVGFAYATPFGGSLIRRNVAYPYPRRAPALLALPAGLFIHLVFNKETKLRTSIKIVESKLDGPREELRRAIAEVAEAETASAQSQAEVDRAADHLRAMQLAHVRASSSLEDARTGQIPLADKLAAAHSDGERWQIVEEHEAVAGRPPLTADDLRKLRQAVEAAEDEVTAARSALDFAGEQARPHTSALNRAKLRREQAIYEVARA